MSIFIHSSGETKSIINGNVMDDKSYDATYNGINMKITGHDKDTKFNVKMTNDDIMDLLAKPSSNLTLKQRLMNDYNVKPSTTQSTKKRIIRTRNKKQKNKKTKKQKNKKNNKTIKQ
jgi:hypothetical protein